MIRVYSTLLDTHYLKKTGHVPFEGWPLDTSLSKPVAHGQDCGFSPTVSSSHWQIPIGQRSWQRKISSCKSVSFFSFVIFFWPFFFLIYILSVSVIRGRAPPVSWKEKESRSVVIRVNSTLDTYVRQCIFVRPVASWQRLNHTRARRFQRNTHRLRFFFLENENSFRTLYTTFKLLQTFSYIFFLQRKQNKANFYLVGYIWGETLATHQHYDCRKCRLRDSWSEKWPVQERITEETLKKGTHNWRRKSTHRA